MLDMMSQVPPGERSPSPQPSSVEESEMRSDTAESKEDNTNPDSPRDESLQVNWVCSESDPDETNQPSRKPFRPFNFTNYSDALKMAKARRREVSKAPLDEPDSTYPWNLSEETSDFAFLTLQEALETGSKVPFPTSTMVDMEKLVVHDIRHPEASKFF